MTQATPNKMVVSYGNGKILKGHSDDFDPTRAAFHLRLADDPSREAIEISVRDLKAVFFVRSFAGDPDYAERKEFFGEPRPAARKVLVEFRDDELLAGYTQGYDPRQPGFFLVPVDPKSNNIRVFAVLASVRMVRLLDW
jgi:hypothetical protein